MIDAHAHLLSSQLDAKQIINNMQSDGLEYIINVGTNVQDSQQGITLANSYNNVFTTVGLHPEYAQDITTQDIMQIQDLAKQNKVVAIGEIGLDYHYGASDELKKKQQEIFIAQIKIASKQGLPIVIHCRDAVTDILDILKNNQQYLNNGFCMHCYSEGATYVQDFINLGAYFSFTGNITFKKADRSFLKDIPQNKIMVETDCPYLSPEPFRGKLNTPKNVVYTAQKIADTLQMDLQAFLKIASQNTKTFFKIK